MSIEIEPLTDDDVDEAIAVINAAFGFERDDDWFRWKHRDGPWGGSSGVIARDGRGIVGVRLLLPWRFTGPLDSLDAHRAVEAATLPRAQGQGVFSLLNQHLMERASRQGGTLIFSTPNERSRTGYAKLGWSWLGPVPHIGRPVAPLRFRGPLLEDGDAIALFRPGTGSHVATAWSPEGLAWRLDRRSGNTYSALATGDGEIGVAFRASRAARLPLLLPLIAWGSPKRRWRLLCEAARREKLVMLLDACPPGGSPVSGTPGRRRGGSLLAVWSTPSLSAAWPVTDLGRWRLGFADLENVL